MTRAFVLLFLAAAAVLTFSCGGDDGGTLRDRATAKTPDSASPSTSEASPSAETGATATTTTAAAKSPAVATAQPTAASAATATRPADSIATTAPSKQVCVVQVTGSQQATITDRGRVAAAESDYWAYAADRISRASEPIDTVLLLSCGGRLGDGEVSVTITPSSDSTYADVPFGPKTYVIAGGGFFEDAARGQFSVILAVGATIYDVSEAGRLTVDVFNTSSISGSFSFNATEASLDDDDVNLKKVRVEGTFDFPCAGSQCRN